VHFSSLRAGSSSSSRKTPSPLRWIQHPPTRHHRSLMTGLNGGHVLVLPDTGKDRDVCREGGQRVYGISEDLLISTVRGLHAEMLDWSRSQRPIITLPIQAILSTDRITASNDPDGEILAYFRDHFGALRARSGLRKRLRPYHL
jgi:hypothetical protein